MPDTTIHGVHEFHGPDEPAHRGTCKVEQHYGEREGVMLLGTIHGIEACGECIAAHHKAGITLR
jgi:hypothetical protein